jgi:hypothetical protein
MAKQVRAARHYQRKDAPLRMIADKAIPGIKRDMKAALSGLGGLIPTSTLTRAKQGDWNGVKSSVNWGHFREVLKASFQRIGKCREAGAQFAVQQINGRFAQRRQAVRFRKVVTIERTPTIATHSTSIAQTSKRNCASHKTPSFNN